MDGTIYAAVAGNLSLGNGSMWEMKFNEILMNPFYEHPPLAIWMEAIFHRLFSDSFLSERMYALFMWLLNGWLVTLMWKEIKPESKLQWAPLLLWVCIPIVVWSFSNNMLENTMGVFVSASVLFFLKGIRTKMWSWSLLSGGMITLAFLSKGFVGLFPFALPVLFLMFFFKKRSFVKHLLSGIYMLIGFGLVALPFVLNETSYDFMMTYFDHQVKNSVENIQTVPHRFKILEYFLLQLFLPMAIAVAIFFSAKNKAELGEENKKWLGMMLLLSLCGVLPIMISLKQRDFYILTVYPFIVLAIVNFVENGFASLHERIAEKLSKPNKVTVPVLLAAIVVAVVATNFYKRDQAFVMGAEQLAESEFYGQTFQCSNDVRYDWAKMAYLSRIAKITVSRSVDSEFKMLLSSESKVDGEVVFEGFKLVKLK